MIIDDFILEHEGDDLSRLLLGKAKWPDIDMVRAVTAIECRRKIRNKLPTWYAEPGIIYPDRLCCEQCSSEATAGYKAEVAECIIRTANDNDRHTSRIADLTGGFGVDSAAFSKVADEVFYNEMDSARAEAARHNFALLGIDNISVSCAKVETSVTATGNNLRPLQAHCRLDETDDRGTDEGLNFWTRLKAFSPDLIFMDPARRSDTGNKVFLLEDCSPDVLTLLPELFSCTGNILLKLSPMADITMLVRRFREHGASVREVHIVGAEGECKELLVWLLPGSTPDCNHSAGTADKESSGNGTRLIIAENGKWMKFNDIQDNANVASFLKNEEALRGMKYLFEPGKALAKSGMFNAVCALLPGLKAGRSTQLYFMEGNEKETDGAGEVTTSLLENGHSDPMESETHISDFGKMFRIIGIEPLNKQTIKDLGSRYPDCDVSARNIPLSSDELRSRLLAAGRKKTLNKQKQATETLRTSPGDSGTDPEGATQGTVGRIHVFGCHVDFEKGSGENFLIICTRVFYTDNRNDLTEKTGILE